MTEVRTVAVIGAGITGRGIAHAAALGGYRTILEDLLPKCSAQSRDRNPRQPGSSGRTRQSRCSFCRIEYAGSVEKPRARPTLSSRLFRRRWKEAHKLGLNHPMAPFELVDLVGLDTRLRARHPPAHSRIPAQIFRRKKRFAPVRCWRNM
jgi:3-hydroxyacyl-CoA dehydrogenase